MTSGDLAMNWPVYIGLCLLSPFFHQQSSLLVGFRVWGLGFWVFWVQSLGPERAMYSSKGLPQWEEGVLYGWYMLGRVHVPNSLTSESTSGVYFKAEG